MRTGEARRAGRHVVDTCCHDAAIVYQMPRMYHRPGGTPARFRERTLLTARPHESFGQPSGVFANLSLSRLLRLPPALTRSGRRNLAPSFRAERGRPSRPALEPAEPSKRSRMRIGLARQDPAGQHLDTLRRRVAAAAGRTDDVGLFRLGLLLEEVANETAPLNGEYGSWRRVVA